MYLARVAIRWRSSPGSLALLNSVDAARTTYASIGAAILNRCEASAGDTALC